MEELSHGSDGGSVCARTRRIVRSSSSACLPLLCGASFRTPNFVVEARTAEHRPDRGRARRERTGSSIAKAWLGTELPGLANTLSDPGQADRGRGRRPDVLRFQQRPGDRPEHGGRGPDRSHPRLGPPARGDAHHLRRLFRRPHAALGRRGSLAPQRGRTRAAPARPDRRRPARPARRSGARGGSSRSRNTPRTSCRSTARAIPSRGS